jgi:hypothetical protein
MKKFKHNCLVAVIFAVLMLQGSCKPDSAGCYPEADMGNNYRPAHIPLRIDVNAINLMSIMVSPIRSIK